MKILGIDPGIANTGLAVVQFEKQKYQLLSSRLVTSSPREREPERLLNIYNHVYGLLNEFTVEIAAIEKVYHNKNVSSSISTGKAIGSAEVALGAKGVDVLLLTPQQVKLASGLGGKADKATLKTIASRIFHSPIKNHHIADAALVALAGCLRYRAVRNTPHTPQKRRT